MKAKLIMGETHFLSLKLCVLLFCAFGLSTHAIGAESNPRKSSYCTRVLRSLGLKTVSIKTAEQRRALDARWKGWARQLQSPETDDKKREEIKHNLFLELFPRLIRHAVYSFSGAHPLDDETFESACIEATMRVIERIEDGSYDPNFRSVEFPDRESQFYSYAFHVLSSTLRAAIQRNERRERFRLVDPQRLRNRPAEFEPPLVRLDQVKYFLSRLKLQMEDLSERQRNIMERSIRGDSLEQIGKDEGGDRQASSKENIRRIRASAIRKIKSSFLDDNSNPELMPLSLRLKIVDLSDRDFVRFIALLESY